MDWITTPASSDFETIHKLYKQFVENEKTNECDATNEKLKDYEYY